MVSVRTAFSWTIFPFLLSEIPNTPLTIRLATEAKVPRIVADQSFPIARTDAKGFTLGEPAVSLLHA